MSSTPSVNQNRDPVNQAQQYSEVKGKGMTQCHPLAVAIGAILCLGALFLLLAACQVLPQGVNALSNLGVWGQLIGYGVLGIGVFVVLVGAVRWHLHTKNEEASQKVTKPQGNNFIGGNTTTAATSTASTTQVNGAVEDDVIRLNKEETEKLQTAAATQVNKPVEDNKTATLSSGQNKEEPQPTGSAQKKQVENRPTQSQLFDLHYHEHYSIGSKINFGHNMDLEVQKGTLLLRGKKCTFCAVTDGEESSKRMAFLLQQRGKLVDKVMEGENSQEALKALADDMRKEWPALKIAGVCLLDELQKTYSVEVFGKAKVRIKQQPDFGVSLVLYTKQDCSEFDNNNGQFAETRHHSALPDDHGISFKKLDSGVNVVIRASKKNALQNGGITKENNPVEANTTATGSAEQKEEPKPTGSAQGTPAVGNTPKPSRLEINRDQLPAIGSLIKFSENLEMEIYEETLILVGKNCDFGAVTENGTSTRELAFLLQQRAALIEKVMQGENTQEALKALAEDLRQELPADRAAGLCVVDRVQKTYSVELFGKVKLNVKIDPYAVGHPTGEKPLDRHLIRLTIQIMPIEYDFEKRHHAALPDKHWVEFKLMDGKFQLRYPHPDDLPR